MEKKSFLQNTHFEEEGDWLCSLELRQVEVLCKDSLLQGTMGWRRRQPCGTAGERTFISDLISKEFLFKHSTHRRIL